MKPLRVIAGSRKGRSIHAVPGKHTRPTTDKMKETLFNLMEQPFFEGGVGLDLYAGTGGLGIEALSRGFDRFIFVEHHPRAIRTLKQNLHLLGFTSQCEVYRNDASRALKAVKKRNLAFQLIFLDPPYVKRTVLDDLVFIDQAQLVKPGGVIVTESGKHAQLPEQVGCLKLDKFHTQGETCLRFYRPHTVHD